MKSSMSKILIETVTRKTIRDMKESPERSIRNLIDMGLLFSEGRFQKHLLQTVQTMLMNESSAYYGLIKNIVRNVEEERLLNFCMNLGYNSCTLGAATIRRYEEEKGYNIPWNIFFEYEREQFCSYRNRYYKLINEGENLGIFTYMIKVEDGPPSDLLPMIAEYPDSVFFLFCEGKYITDKFVTELASYTNIMFLIKCDATCQDRCWMLRERELLYGIYYTYTDNDLKDIESGLYWMKAEEMNAVATVLIADKKCSKETFDIVSEHITRERFLQKYQTIEWELYHDNCFIDEVISDDACFVYFDKNGKLCGPVGEKKQEENNLYHNPLQNILMRVYPK
ncbi:MAG: hypothetical protein IJ397_07770 [Lachnospiraceae bacterium]|nr:hypothetical protein [Lachnospiraceae bacterium]